MFDVKTLAIMSAVALAPVAGSAATVAIDTFDTAQLAIDPAGSGFSDSNTVAAGEAIGGNRTITADGNGTLFPVSTTTINVGGGSATVSNSSGVTGTGLFEWNAGGADLTDGGTNALIVLSVIDVDLDVQFDLTIDGATSSATSASTAGDIFFSFADFGDLSSASSISLLVSGPDSFDAEFDFIGAAQVPLPAGGLLLGSILLGGGFAARRKAKAQS